MMITHKKFLTFSFVIAAFGITGVELPVYAQEDRPVLGRPDKPPTSTNNTNPGERKPRVRRNRNNNAAAKSPVPKGKPLEFYVRKGSELIDSGDFELADLFFEEAEKHRKDKGVAPELLELLDKQTQVVDLHIEAGELTNDPEKALATYQEILKLRPNDDRAKQQLPALFVKLADAALEKKDFPAAVEFYTQLAGVDPAQWQQNQPKLVTALVGRGEAELAAGNSGQAQSTFKRVLELDPKNTQAQTRLQALDILSIVEFAENKLKAGAYEDALNKFKEVLALDPENERAKQGLPVAQGNYFKLKAEQFYNNRKYDEAEQNYKDALALLPADEDIKRRLDELVLRLSPVVPARGKSVWRGKVSGPLKIAIRGKELSYPEGDGGDGALSERLPDVSYLVKRVKKLSGSANVRIVEQPSATNGYNAVFAVEAKKSENYSFEIEWEIKRQGTVTWRGQLAGRSLIRVQGPFIDLEQISGEAAKEVSYQGEALPRLDTLVKLRKVSGKADVRLVEPPSQANSFIATIAVDGTDSESELLSFELSWQLK